jgi:hypothetical protein
MQDCNFAFGSLWVGNLIFDIKEHKLRVFENWVMRIFGPRGDEVRGEWRKLHNEELHNLYSLPSIIRMTEPRMKWAGYVTPVR